MIELGDPPEAWARLGFAPDEAGELELGGMRLRLTGRGGGILSVHADGLTADRPDGLPLHPSAKAQSPVRDAPQPNGAVAVDHVVALTGSLARTVTALTEAGLDRRRTTEDGRMAFLRLGPCILEVVEHGGDPPRFWGLVVVVEEIDGLGPLVGPAQDAVQPGRRIATVSRDAGLATALALMTPRRT